MSKVALGILIGVLVTGAIFGAYLLGKGSLTTPLDLTPSSPDVTETINPSFSPSVNPSASLSPSSKITGIAKGKLCYPSEFIPPGKIEAKRLSDNLIFVQNYLGSGSESKNTYEFELEEGSYNFRFFIDDKTIGYHTKTCPTGLETSCGADNAREHLDVNINPGKTVENIDLCDFYYSDKTKPIF